MQTVTPAHSDDRISQTVGSVTTTYVLDTATPLTNRRLACADFRIDRFARAAGAGWSD